MQTHFLFDALEELAPFREIVEAAAKPGAVIAASGLAGAQKIHLACALAKKTGRPLVFLAASERDAAEAMEDVSSLMDGGVSLFPAREITFYQDVAASREVAFRRIETLRRLVTGEVRAVVAPADALLHRLMPRDVFAMHTIRVAVGDRMEIDYLCEMLLAAGYSREYMVEGKAEGYNFIGKPNPVPENKQLLIVPTASHCDLYDGGYTELSGGGEPKNLIPWDKLEAFFKENLK